MRLSRRVVRGTREIAADKLPYAPQYPLWSDGAAKRRWLYLPPGSRIDASDPEAWQFPPGTKLWKEFGFERPVETRYMERLPDGSWRFAAYVWDADGNDARLAPPEGIRSLPVPRAPGGTYTIPSREPPTQMPPLGTAATDHEAVALVARWIRNDLQETYARQENPR